MTSGLETELYYSGTIGKNGKSKRIDEASKEGKKEKVKDTKR